MQSREHLIATFPKGVCAEVGVWKGEFARQILNCNPKKLYLIDCWESQSGSYADDPTNQSNFDAIYADILNEFSQPNVEILRAYSAQAAMQFPDGYFDWLYLDADHSYEAVRDELAQWYPKVKPRGWLAGHDYFEDPVGFPWVQTKRAVDEFVASHSLELVVASDDIYPSWAVQKPNQ